jgi:hypothetical protein
MVRLPGDPCPMPKTLRCGFGDRSWGWGVTQTINTKQRLALELAEYFQADGERLFEEMCQGILKEGPRAADKIAAATLSVVRNHASAIIVLILNVDGGSTFC